MSSQLNNHQIPRMTLVFLKANVCREGNIIINEYS